MNVAALMTRAKAIAALAVTLVLGLVGTIPDSGPWRVLVAIATALVAAGVVHQVPNAGVAPVQDVVDAITAAVPPETAAVVADTVNLVSRGVLKTATSAAGTVPS